MPIADDLNQLVIECIVIVFMPSQSSAAIWRYQIISLSHVISGMVW